MTVTASTARKLKLIGQGIQYGMCIACSCFFIWIAWEVGSIFASDAWGEVEITPITCHTIEGRSYFTRDDDGSEKKMSRYVTIGKCNFADVGFPEPRDFMRKAGEPWTMVIGGDLADHLQENGRVSCTGRTQLWWKYSSQNMVRGERYYSDPKIIDCRGG